MLASDSSDDGVMTSLLGKRTRSPPVAMRSSKSVISQVRDTLFSFIKRAKGDSTNNDSDDNKEISSSSSEKQRTIEAYTERVKSFSVPNWMGKPLCLSPPLLAQYGWQCIGVDTIKCCSCSAVLCVRLPWPNADNYRQQCYNYRQKILTSHMKICAWPSYPCPDSFVSPLFHGSQGVAEICSDFVERRRNLLLLGPQLPQLDLNILDEINLQRTDLKKLENIQPVTSDPDACLSVGDNTGSGDFSEFSDSDVATILSMCGWTSSLTSASPSICCKPTGRIIRLHNFFRLGESMSYTDGPGTDPQATGTEVVPVDMEMPCEIFESPPKRLKTETIRGVDPTSPLKITKQNFHPLKQHCPWSSWVTVLKPISKEEFDDDDKKFQFVINPVLTEAKPGWRVVRNSLLGHKPVGDKAARLLTESSHKLSDNEQIMEKTEQETAAGDVQKTPAKSAVAHVRKLLREWSSPK